MTMIDATLPALYIPYPQCGHCLNDVVIDDGVATCETCLIEWHDISEDATAEPDSSVEGSDVPCHIEPAEKHHEFDHDGRHYTTVAEPCILPSGHEGEHLHPKDISYIVTDANGDDS